MWSAAPELIFSVEAPSISLGAFALYLLFVDYKTYEVWEELEDWNDGTQAQWDNISALSVYATQTIPFECWTELQWSLHWVPLLFCLFRSCEVSVTWFSLYLRFYFQSGDISPFTFSISTNIRSVSQTTNSKYFIKFHKYRETSIYRSRI
jgi:hypothetical protein